MKRKIILLELTALVILNSCCWTDHSEEIKKIAVPMAKELEHFYEKEKRFPKIEERDKMLEKVGCKMDRGVCRYNSIGSSIITIKSDRTSYDYNIFFETENTYCFCYLRDNGDITIPVCKQNPCIELGQ